MTLVLLMATDFEDPFRRKRKRKHHQCTSRFNRQIRFSTMVTHTPPFPMYQLPTHKRFVKSATLHLPAGGRLLLTTARARPLSVLIHGALLWLWSPAVMDMVLRRTLQACGRVVCYSSLVTPTRRVVVICRF
jgi:hypothetical protein